MSKLACWRGALAKWRSSAHPMMSDVEDADWGPDNQIAVARYVDGHFLALSTPSATFCCMSPPPAG